MLSTPTSRFSVVGASCRPRRRPRLLSEEARRGKLLLVADDDALAPRGPQGPRFRNTCDASSKDHDVEGDGVGLPGPRAGTGSRRAGSS